MEIHSIYGTVRYRTRSIWLGTFEIDQLTLVIGATLLVIVLRKLRLALPRPIVVDVASAFLVGLGVLWYISRSYVEPSYRQLAYQWCVYVDWYCQ
jgi:hypothetical protein